MVKCEVPDCANERLMGWRHVGCKDRFRMVCRVYADRHHNQNDAFDLHEVFGLQRNTGPNHVVSESGVKRFPDFGKELRRPFAVHANCYDCAAFYEGCQGWRAAREFGCSHYQQLPDVMPGTCGQPWPENVFVPTNPNTDRESTKQRPAPTKPKDPDKKANGARHCDCGEPMTKGKRCCDVCRAKRRRKTMRQYMQRRRAG